MTEAYIGVDVGTLSARAGVFDSAGRLIASARRPIAIWREPDEIVEQSSDDIWRAATSAVREAVEASGLHARGCSRHGFRRDVFPGGARSQRASSVGQSDRCA